MPGAGGNSISIAWTSDVFFFLFLNIQFKFIFLIDEILTSELHKIFKFVPCIKYVTTKSFKFIYERAL